MKLRNSLLSAACAMAMLAASAATPRYVFYFIGDGMGMGQTMAGQTYNSVVLENDEPLLMTTFPVVGIVETYSANRRVTDSAAAGTALATGHKTNNGMIGVTPDTVAVNSVAKELHDAGWGVALVTTSSPDDATPAAFYAHVPSRRQYYDIGRAAAESGYEFIAGSDWRGITDKETGADTGLFDYMRSHGMDLTTTPEQARRSKSRRVTLYSENPFYSDNAGYTIDSVATALKLPEMTDVAIEHMMRVSPDRFFMMVEGGNIDHGGHSNDGATIAVEVYNFNQALRRAYDFYLEHPDETVIIVTADHETGGMSIGNSSNGYKSYFKNIPLQRCSKVQFSNEVEELLSQSDSTLTWDAFKQFTSERTGLWRGVKVKDEQAKKLKKLFKKTFEAREKLDDQKTLYASFNALSNEVFAVLNENVGFGFSTWSHSGNPVPMFAIGEGTQIFGGVLDNTDVAPALLRLANPKMRK